MTEYAIIIEDVGSNFCACVPDFQGCIDAADTIEETRQLVDEAWARHLEMLRDIGEPVAESYVRATVVQIAS